MNPVLLKRVERGDPSIQPFDPELIAEGLMTEGLTAEGFLSPSIFIRKPNIYTQLTDG
jgi:hypothetical protein